RLRELHRPGLRKLRRIVGVDVGERREARAAEVVAEHRPVVVSRARPAGLRDDDRAGDEGRGCDDGDQFHTTLGPWSCLSFTLTTEITETTEKNSTWFRSVRSVVASISVLAQAAGSVPIHS